MANQKWKKEKKTQKLFLYVKSSFMLTVIMYHLHKDWNKIVLDKLTHPIQYQGQRVGLN
jgi:hypothetical protein